MYVLEQENFSPAGAQPRFSAILAGNEELEL